jgi:uncharacterized protein YjiK
MKCFLPLLSVLVFACSANSQPSAEKEAAKGFFLPYDLNQPTFVHALSKELEEVSGLSDFDESHVACVQDEKGIIYILDLATGAISNQFEFESDDDFEGVAFVNPSFYVLRSDGRITYIPDYRQPKEHRNIKEKIPTKDNEGLCYDVANNRLLIAAKSKPNKDSKLDKEDRLFYQFDLNAMWFDAEPLFKLSVNEVTAAAKAAGIKVPVDGSTKQIDFRPSSIAIHPETKQIYILSAADFLLVVCNPKGELMSVEQLNPKRFPKAESITFMSNSTMVIANEGVRGKATMLVFQKID